MDTLSTWKYSTAAVPPPCLTQGERALKAVGNEGGSGNEGAGGEGPGGESGGEGSESGSEEGSGAIQLAPDETFDMVRGGARLVLSYDVASNSFRGTVRTRPIMSLTGSGSKVHLSNGTELGPTTPVDLAPGQTLPITLASTQASFTGWVAHAERRGAREASRAVKVAVSPGPSMTAVESPAANTAPAASGGEAARALRSGPSEMSGLPYK